MLYGLVDIKTHVLEPPIHFFEMDWSGFEPEAFPVQGGRYTRFNYQPLEQRQF